MLGAEPTQILGAPATGRRVLRRPSTAHGQRYTELPHDIHAAADAARRQRSRRARSGREEPVVTRRSYGRYRQILSGTVLRRHHCALIHV